MTRPESQPRPPLALLADGWEERARQLSEKARTEEDAHLSWHYGGRADEAQACAAQLRETLRAQAEAEAGVWLICWEPGDPYESGGIEDGAWRTVAEAEIVRARLEAEERASWAAYPGYGVKTYTLEFRPFALAQAGGES